MKTGSELTSEMVGPAGSTRNDGDFSCWTGGPEDELWREPEELSDGRCADNPAARQRTVVRTTNCDGKEVNRIKKTLSASLVRRTGRVKREVPIQVT
jgi:hypothetical protein